LDFEKPIAELEGRAQEMRQMATEGGDQAVLLNEAAKCEAKAQQLLKDAYGKLNPWQKTQVARHPNRPHFTDYINELVEDFTPLAGDRGFGEDGALIAGLGRFRGQSIAVIGHEKGADTQSRLKHNFGMAKPEGYRKSVRIMELADRFGLPVISIIDTPGAYPGMEGEERGQAEAIARSTDACLRLGVPLVSLIIGEGGSGGAVALATGNKVLMLEHAIYSVITPEGCASILWHDSDKAKDAAAAMKLTAQDLQGLNIIDDIVDEPVGGAHRDAAKTIADSGSALERALNSLSGMDREPLRLQRRGKYLEMGRTGLS
jgi:acetyl-CoA carboxylase carboxyl transferase subunit alpha